MSLVEALVLLFVGTGFGIFVIVILQKERAFTAATHLQGLNRSVQQFLVQRDAIKKNIAVIKNEIRDLERTTMGLRAEREAIEVAWRRLDIALPSTRRVNMDEAMMFGRGPEWVYLYTFPVHEKLAQVRNEKNYPMKLGMSTQASVVDRIEQQVMGNSTAIAERAVVRLVFRVRGSRDVERWMHDYLKRNGRQLSDSVGVEWFNTNSVEVEQLFRSYVLQQLGAAPGN